LDEITKQDLTDFVVALKKQGLADRTIDNRLTDLGTFLHNNNVALSLHQSYTEKKVRAYSIEELRALERAPSEGPRHPRVTLADCESKSADPWEKWLQVYNHAESHPYPSGE